MTINSHLSSISTTGMDMVIHNAKRRGDGCNESKNSPFPLRSNETVEVLITRSVDCFAKEVGLAQTEFEERPKANH